VWLESTPHACRCAETSIRPRYWRQRLAGPQTSQLEAGLQSASLAHTTPNPYPENQAEHQIVTHARTPMPMCDPNLLVLRTCSLWLVVRGLARTQGSPKGWSMPESRAPNTEPRTPSPNPTLGRPALKTRPPPVDTPMFWQHANFYPLPQPDMQRGGRRVGRGSLTAMHRCASAPVRRWGLARGTR
jgi:hypothetical protein